MGDGAEESCLDRVRAPQRCRLHHATEQILPLEGGAEERLERRDDPLLEPPQVGLGGAGADEQGADAGRPVAQWKRDLALVGLDGVHLDRCRAQLQCLGETRGGRGEGLGEAVAAEKQPRHLGGEVGLATAVLRVAVSPAGDLRDGAGEKGHDHERHQRHPVAGVGDREAPDGRKVKEVEGGRAQQAGGEAEP